METWNALDITVCHLSVTVRPCQEAIHAATAAGITGGKDSVYGLESVTLCDTGIVLHKDCHVVKD